MDNAEKILEKLQTIEIAQAVTNEKLSNMNTQLSTTSDSLDSIEKRVDTHDKMVAGVIIAVTILGLLVKFKLI